MTDTLRTVRHYASAHHICRTGDTIVCGLSGGGDSVALLLLLREMGVTVHAAHCNFTLRGDESDRDEKFVRSLCQRLDVPLTVERYATRELAAKRHEGIEATARALRYDFFERLRRQIHATDIAVAHHRDDNVETMLLHLVRGTGLAGLAGMRPRNGHVVRPLLCVSHQDLLTYLHTVGQDYVTDSTNLVADCDRNRIRLHVLPLLRTLNSAADANMARTMDNLAAAQTICQRAINDMTARCTMDDGTVSLESLRSTPAPLAVLHAVLAPYGFSRSQEQDILRAASRTGATFCTATHTAFIDRGRLIVRTNEERHGGSDNADGRIVDFDDVLEVSVEERTREFVIDRAADVAQLDADRLHIPLTVRRVAVGDRFVPLGMSGSRLLSDFLTDLKLTRDERAAQLVVLSGTTIVWVVGRRIAHSVRVTDNTRRIATIRLKKQPDNCGAAE